MKVKNCTRWRVPGNRIRDMERKEEILPRNIGRGGAILVVVVVVMVMVMVIMVVVVMVVVVGRPARITTPRRLTQRAPQCKTDPYI